MIIKCQLIRRHNSAPSDRQRRRRRRCKMKNKIYNSLQLFGFDPHFNDIKAIRLYKIQWLGCVYWNSISITIKCVFFFLFRWNLKHTQKNWVLFIQEQSHPYSWVYIKDSCQCQISGHFPITFCFLLFLCVVNLIDRLK